MSAPVIENIPALSSMKKYPKTLFYKGDLTLLQRPKVSIVGTRNPTNYTREFTYMLSKALAKRGVCVVSGAAMGVDAIAHAGAGEENTIAVRVYDAQLDGGIVHGHLRINFNGNGLPLDINLAGEFLPTEA